MDHTPYIAGAYGIGVIVLLWTAVAPLIKKKNVVRDIRRLIEIEDRNDSNS